MILPTAHPHRSADPRHRHPRHVRMGIPLRQVACLLAIPVAYSITASTSASGQEPVRVSGTVTCQDCTITLDTVVTIGGLDGPGVGAIGRMSSVAIDRRGRILVWNAGGAEIAVFDMTGGFVRTVGGRGEGPGEYSSISRIDVGPRYIHVFEYHRGRTVLDHDFNVIRTDMFPGQVFNTFVTESDEVAFAASVPTSTSTGYRFHLLGESGNTVSFGEGAESARGATAPQDMFAAAGDSELYDGWIDLVDPSTGATLARYHGDEFLAGFAAGSRCVVTHQETDAGVPYIHLLEPRLSRGPGN